MIKISSFLLNDKATRVYGDYVEKVAFALNVDPGLLLGSIAGGLTVNHLAQKTQQANLEQQQLLEQKNRTIQSGAYNQVESLLHDLKIVFTPINVIYSVNGQVFEIISVDEMNPYMRQAFIQKDANYFRDLLMNKVNMEMQLAEQAFAQRLLTAKGYGEQTKQANFIEKQEHLMKLSEDEMDALVKTASVGLDGISLKIDPSLESLRPFSRSHTFFNPNELEKVAGIFELNDDVQDVGVHQLNSQVNVGFLPDRVVFLWHGQMVDQLTLLHMNEEGYEAFLKQDKAFFIDLFRKHTQDVAKGLQEQPTEPNHLEPAPEEPKEASEDLLERLEKVAFGFEEHVATEPLTTMERDQIEPFTDPDIHPIVYDQILRSKYGKTWARHELEALFKQLEVDFGLSGGIAENPLNKVSILHVISNSDHAMYLSSFTFEKFVRGINSKTIMFEDYQGNLSVEEIMFALEIAKVYSGEEVFFEFHPDVAAYVAEELMDDVRFVSSVLYDETNPSERDFFQHVNAFLMRKWKEEDALGFIEKEDILHRYRLTEQIVEISDEVMKQYGNELDIEDPYGSARYLLESASLLDSVNPEDRTSVGNQVVSNVVAHLTTSLFLDYKHEEFDYTVMKLQEEGVING